ncbi:MAG: PKD domain-containing protein [Candidatus Marinimicrobia bacterium]|nr:PKD domain-containing protein [Candidatus Neomarinimicrobiota bacterium]
MKKSIAYFSLVLSILVLNQLCAQTVIAKEQNSKVQLWIEAEAGDIHEPMMIHDTEAASGGQYIEVRGGNNNIQNAPSDGHTVYRFSLKEAGTYKIWGRVKIDMSDEDAFWVKIDDEDWVKWKGIEVGCKWHWDEVHDNLKNNQVVTYDLDAGTHTLVFTYGMDQTRLDKLLITNDLEFVPTEIGPRAAAVFSISSATPIVGETLIFDGSESFSTLGNVTSYTWEFGDGGTGSGRSVRHAFDKVGSYNVKLIVSDDKGLTGRLTKTVTVYTKEPVACFDYFPDRAKAGEIITFDASPSFDPGGSIIKYRWDFGDGSRGKGPIVKHVYKSAGEYRAMLRVTDRDRNKVSITRLITVITGVPKKIIYETDMCLDVDDVGGLAMLHGLANNDEAELLAVCFNEVHPSGAAAIDAINTWYGRGDIPVGIYKKNLPDPDPSDYLDIVAEFPHDLDRETAPEAVDVYREVLSKQADKSVTIISVGFIVNLYDILKAEPVLVAAKVKELVIMGGPGGGGFNLARHNTREMTAYVLANWPSPIVFSGAGTGIFTGEGLENSPIENPVREAYYNFFNSNFCGRHSWDQMAILYGVRGISDYFAEPEDVDRWQLGPGQRLSLHTLLTRNEYARIIENLMLKSSLK